MDICIQTFYISTYSFMFPNLITSQCALAFVMSPEWLRSLWSRPHREMRKLTWTGRMMCLCQELLGWTGMSMSRLLIPRLSVFWGGRMRRYYKRGVKVMLPEWWRREILMTGPSSQGTLRPPLAAFFCCDTAVSAMQSEISYLSWLGPVGTSLLALSQVS